MNYYQKYLKYKNKYLRLKQVAGGLVDKVYVSAIHELDNIQKLLDESVLCSTNEKKEINVIKFKELLRELVNNIALNKSRNENVILLNNFKISYYMMLDSITNKCNVETIETIRVKFEYINEELIKLVKNHKYGGLIIGNFIVYGTDTVEVAQINGRKSININYFNKETGETTRTETISMLAAEEGERLMKEAIRTGPAPPGSIFRLGSNPAKQVYITDNIGNFRVNFEKIDKIENEGQAKEKLVFEVPKTVWNKTLTGFLAEYTRVK